MTRSLEALQKRAAKRNISVEEQRKKDGKTIAPPVKLTPRMEPTQATADAQKTKEKSKARDQSKISSNDRSSVSVTSIGVKRPIAEVVTTAAAPTGWTCVKCSNNNFLKRDTCNRCGEARPEESVEVPSCNTTNGESCSAAAAVAADVSNPLNRKIKDIEKAMKTLPTKPSTGTANIHKNSWTTHATEEQIKENARLVNILVENDEDAKAKLTPEQLDRAETLYKRRLRKQLAKAKMQRYKAKSKSGVAV